MGCDIHAYIEIKVKGVWQYGGVANISRRYGVFGAMTAGAVCGDDPELGLKIKGLPADVSSTVNTMSEDYGSDGHSHSYLTPEELTKLREKFDEWNKMPCEPGHEAYKEDDDWYLEEFGLLDRHFYLMDFAEDRKRNDPTDEYDYLQSKYIEDVRLVFWFDN